MASAPSRVGPSQAGTTPRDRNPVDQGVGLSDSPLVLARCTRTDAVSFARHVAVFFLADEFRLVRSQRWEFEDVLRLVEDRPENHLLILHYRRVSGFVSMGCGAEPSFEIALHARYRCTGTSYSILLTLAEIKRKEGVHRFRTRINVRNIASLRAARKAGWIPAVSLMGRSTEATTPQTAEWLDFELCLEPALNQPTAKQWLGNSKSRVALVDWKRSLVLPDPFAGASGDLGADGGASTTHRAQPC